MQKNCEILSIKMFKYKKIIIYFQRTNFIFIYEYFENQQYWPMQKY